MQAVRAELDPILVENAERINSVDMTLYDRDSERALQDWTQYYKVRWRLRSRQAPRRRDALSPGMGDAAGRALWQQDALA